MNSFKVDAEKASSEPEKALPNNISNEEDLAFVPAEYINDEDPKRPLKFTDKDGSVYKFALKPLVYSVLFILLVECLERFTYYGINNTQTAFLTGVYDAHWNANMTATEAASMTSLSVAVAYSSPFLGAILADGLLGDFWNIVFGTSLLYIPGIILIALTTIPQLLGSTFNLHVLCAGLFVLISPGNGIH